VRIAPPDSQTLAGARAVAVAVAVQLLQLLLLLRLLLLLAWRSAALASAQEGGGDP